MSSRSTMMTEMLLLLFRLLVIALLSPRVFSLFLSSIGGAPKIDLSLFVFSITKTDFISLFLDSKILAGETNIVVLEEAILEKINHTPNWFNQK